MGKIFKFDKDVDTDQIIASQYLLYPTIDEMKVHTFESLDKDFAANVKPGDYVVASDNFGCGSSREHAPIAIKAAGVSCVIAETFARIFYRVTGNLLQLADILGHSSIEVTRIYASDGIMEWKKSMEMLEMLVE